MAKTKTPSRYRVSPSGGNRFVGRALKVWHVWRDDGAIGGKIMATCREKRSATTIVEALNTVSPKKGK